MDPVILLKPGEKVLLEQWFYKRKAGFEDDEMNGADGASVATEGTQSSLDSFSVMHSQIAPSGGRLESMLMRKVERKRFFALTMVPGDRKNNVAPQAFLYYLSRKPKYKDMEEKPEQKDALDLGRMAKEAWQQELNFQLIRGRLELTETTQVTLSDNGEIKLVVPGKSLMIRPVEKHPAEVKVIAGQFYSTVRSVVKDIWMFQNLRDHKSGTRTMQKSNPNVDFGECPDTLDGVLSSPVFRMHFSLFCEFSQGAENLQFYDLVQEYEDKYATILNASMAADGSGGGGGGGRKMSTAKRGSLSSRLRRLSRSGSSSSGGEERKIIPKDIRYLGEEIIEKFVKEGAERQVNLSDPSRNAILQAYKKKGNQALTADLFTKAKQEIFALMESNYFLRFYREEMRKTGAFSSLFAKNGLNGYEAVIANFGLVKTDLTRLLETYKLRMEQTEAQLAVLRDSLHISHDVAVRSLRTTADALVHLYRTSAVRIQALGEFKTQLDEHVVFPLTWLSKSIDLQLESIIEGDRAAIHHCDQARTNLEDARRLQQDLQVLKQFQGMDDLANPEAEERLKRHNMSPDQVDAKIQDTKDAVAIAEMALTRSTKEMDDRIISSLDKLESLEIHRLESQQRAVKHATEAEKVLFSTLKSDIVTSQAVFGKVDPVADVQSFVRAFTEKLEENHVPVGAQEEDEELYDAP